MSTVESYTTKISAKKTASQIQEVLSGHGVTRIGLEFEDGAPTGIAFETATELGPRAFRLPDDWRSR